MQLLPWLQLDLNSNMVVVDEFLSKQQGAPLADPLAFFPLTRRNLRKHLPQVLRQFLSYDLVHQTQYEAIATALYAPNAQFHYPGAALRGRHAICQFWNSFLLGRALMFNDVHSLHIDLNWDEEKLQAVVQMEAWQHLKPLAWLDRLLKVPGWKVWTSFVLQFEECPGDGSQALRVVFHEELVDQFVFLGCISLGLYCIRTDPGTPLNWARDMMRHIVGGIITWGTPPMLWLLKNVGVIKRASNT